VSALRKEYAWGVLVGYYHKKDGELENSPCQTTFLKRSTKVLREQLVQAAFLQKAGEMSDKTWAKTGKKAQGGGVNC